MIPGIRFVKKFAWFPMHVENNKIVWLKYYYVKQIVADVKITGRHTYTSLHNPVKWIDWEEFSFLPKQK